MTRESDNEDLLQQVIFGDAKEARESEDQIFSSEESIRALRDEIDAMMLEFERAGNTGEYQSNIADYIKDLRDELKSIKFMRNTATFVTLAAAGIIFYWICKYLGYYWTRISPNVDKLSKAEVNTLEKIYALNQVDPTLQATVFVSLISAGVFLLTILLRGLYRTRNERNVGEMLPEALRIATQAIKKDN